MAIDKPKRLTGVENFHRLKKEAAEKKQPTEFECTWGTGVIGPEGIQGHGPIGISGPSGAKSKTLNDAREDMRTKVLQSPVRPKGYKC